MSWGGIAVGGTARKYRNLPATVDGIRFDSRLEAQVYAQLVMLRQAGLVSYFLRQVPIHLPGGVTYRLDFLVFYPGGAAPRYLDAKGVETQVYRLKKRQVEALYPIKIEPVRKVRGRLVGLLPE